MQPNLVAVDALFLAILYSSPITKINNRPRHEVGYLLKRNGAIF